jgi:hypothetical protein
MLAFRSLLALLLAGHLRDDAVADQLKFHDGSAFLKAQGISVPRAA